MATETEARYLAAVAYSMVQRYGDLLDATEVFHFMGAAVTGGVDVNGGLSRFETWYTQIVQKKKMSEIAARAKAILDFSKLGAVPGDLVIVRMKDSIRLNDEERERILNEIKMLVPQGVRLLAKPDVDLEAFSVEEMEEIIEVMQELVDERKRMEEEAQEAAENADGEVEPEADGDEDDDGDDDEPEEPPKPSLKEQAKAKKEAEAADEDGESNVESIDKGKKPRKGKGKKSRKSS